MAAVYKAYEESLDRYVALKVLTAHFLHDRGASLRPQQVSANYDRVLHRRKG